eukprot:PhM_4_TR1047/c0_g1_i1/m.86884
MTTPPPPPRGTFTIGSLEKVKSDEEYLELMHTVPKTVRPTSITDFGYDFNSEGQLRNVRTGEPFQWLGQKHYDALGDVIIKDIQRMLVSKYGLVEVWLPRSAGAGEPQVNIFHSANYLECEKLCLVMQGSGAVRAGQWARALCINDTLKHGTIFDYLDDFKTQLGDDVGVIVFNPNLNSGVVQKEDAESDHEHDVYKFWLGTDDKTWKLSQRAIAQSEKPIPSHERPQIHTVTVWEEFVRPSIAKHVVIVAHSFAGVSVAHLVRTCFEEVSARVRAIAFTDACHDVRVDDRKEHVAFLRERSINWVGSKLPLDKPVRSRDRFTWLSAGHDTHEYTSSYCRASAMKYLVAAMPKLQQQQNEEEQKETM